MSDPNRPATLDAAWLRIEDLERIIHEIHRQKVQLDQELKVERLVVEHLRQRLAKAEAQP